MCRFDVELDNLEDLKRLLAFSSRYVQNLLLEQLPSHLNMEIIFDGLGKCVQLDTVLPKVPMSSQSISIYIQKRGHLHSRLSCDV